MANINGITMKARVLLAGSMLLGLSACGTYERYRADHPFKFQDVAVNRGNVPTGRVSVEIRWPVAFSHEASAALKKYFHTQTDKVYDSNTECNTEYRNCEPMEVDRIPHVSLLEAAEMHALIKRDNPFVSVVLTPVIVSADPVSGVLSYRATQLPKAASAVVINMMDTWMYGGYAAPISALRANTKIFEHYQPQTCGFVAAINAGLHAPMKSGQCGDASSRSATGFAMISYLASNVAFEDESLPTVKAPNVAGGGRVALPKWMYEYGEPYVSLSARPGFSATGATIQSPQIADYARLSVQALNKVKWESFGSPEDLPVIEFFDPVLAKRVSNKQELSGKDAVNLDVIHKLAVAEVQWLSNKSDFISQEVLNGPFGKSMRNERLALAEARRKEDAATWASIFALAAAGANSGLFSKVGGGMYDPGAMLQSYLKIDSAYNESIAKIGDELMKSFVNEDTLRDQRIQILFGSKAEQVSVGNLSELHKGLRSLYLKYRK